MSDINNIKSNLSISSNLNGDVLKNLSFPLPKKYENLVHLFSTMENVVSIAHGRNMKITFDRISKNVSKHTKMAFTENHLTQIIGLYPKSYKLRWDKRRQPVGRPLGEKPFDLVLIPNLNDDLEPYYKKLSISQKNSVFKTTEKITLSPPKIFKYNEKSNHKGNRKSLVVEEKLSFTTKLTNRSVDKILKPNNVIDEEAKLILKPKNVIDDEAKLILNKTKLSQKTFLSPKKENITEMEEHNFSNNNKSNNENLLRTPVTLIKNYQNIKINDSPNVPSTPEQSLPSTKKKGENNIKKKTENVVMPSTKNDSDKQSCNDFNDYNPTYKFTSPIKLISPIKRKNQRDFINCSPIKGPVVPVPRLAQVDLAPKFEGWRKNVRKLIFRHLLVLKVKEIHLNFIEKNNLVVPNGKLLHPNFELESTIDDLPTIKIPQIPESNKPLRSALDYFKSVPKKEEKQENCTNIVKHSPTVTPTNKSNNSPSLTLTNKSNILTKKTNLTLLDRIKAREAAKKVIDKDRIIALENEQISLQLLNKSIIEVVCSHFRLSNRRVMNFRDLFPLVTLSCGEIDKDNFLKHIDVLCAAAPNFCKKEIIKDGTFLKILNLRVDKIKHCIEERLECVHRELRLIK